MDQVTKDFARVDEELKPIASALGDGAILVDASGQILWIDDNLRRRLNGGLQKLELPIRRSERPALDCFITTADVMIDNVPRPVCVIQHTADQKESWQFIAAIEAIMADSSWLTRMIVEKFSALRHGTRSPPRSSDIDILTGREREVLWFICEGRSDSEMSETLHLSQNTVRNHIASLYRKIGVNRRSAAVIWARERAVTSEEALSPRRSSRHPGQMSRGDGLY
ncbi:LuxR C-terminal-related transcriptional regulator [Bradyrhizobium sp. LB11.1]|uniref:helix-turn-helix transcriptional regulator n=1 Tax=Bradyrhizobium sp. LB11.1 TaxID=3156326 RepID=UPI00339ABD98